MFSGPKMPIFTYKMGYFMENGKKFGEIPPLTLSNSINNQYNVTDNQVTVTSQLPIAFITEL